MIYTDSTPLYSIITFDFPLNQVKDAINFLLQMFPQYFIAKKNGINNVLGTYVFDRPKGVDTPTIRMTVSSIDNNKTKVEFSCSSNSISASSSDYQVAITEVQNILIAKLKGRTDQEVLEVIKKNNSGNGFWGGLKTVGCVVFVIIVIIFIIGSLYNLLK